MQSYVAEIGEIVRAQRRDEEELDSVRDRLSGVLKELLGQRRWLRLFPYLGSISEALYYSCTLLSGTQTLGEEYVRLFESIGTSRNVPSWFSRLIFVFLHVFAPLIAQHAIYKAQKKLNHPSTSQFLGIPLQNKPEARKNLQTLVEWIRSTGIPQLRRLHLAVFYIYGAYYNISRRATGIRFLSLSPQTDIGALKVYRILGYLTFLQTAISLFIWLVSFLEEEKKRSLLLKENRSKQKCELVRQEDWSHSWFRCGICLESRNPCSTPCGHLFCWSCIQEHAYSSDSESKCPQCRSVFDPSVIVPLLNL